MMLTYWAVAQYFKEKHRNFSRCCIEFGLDVNVDKTRYMVMSRDQNVGRSHNIKTGDSACERL